MKVFVIEAQTGCSCCSDENHYRGMFKTKEDAQKRIDFYLKEGNFYPIASQYSKRGRYDIVELNFEKTTETNRTVLGDKNT